MVVRKISSDSTTSTSSSDKSSLKSPSTHTEDCYADDEDAMSTDDFDSPRPLSVAIPNAYGPFCPRRPNLREILANASYPPWTLAAFMAYLSNNHCLETLEFTMDAGRYKKHYAKMLSRSPEGVVPPAKDREYVQALWQRLVEAYIQPNGTREVNLPSNVRDPILRLKPSTLPPAPETLDPAVAKIYELMEDSVLVPFLNSVYPQSAAPTVSSYALDASDETMSNHSYGYPDRSEHSWRARNPRASPPLSSLASHGKPSPPPSLFRKSAPSRFSPKLTPSTSSPAAMAVPGQSEGTLSVPAGMTDDSGSTDSPTADSPTTPPLSPPLSDLKRDSGVWKRLGRLGGMKMNKKKSHGGLSTTTTH